MALPVLPPEDGDVEQSDADGGDDAATSDPYQVSSA